MFKTPTCGQCPAQIDILEELIPEYEGVSKEIIDATQNMDRANEYGVRSFPTTVILDDDGEAVRQFNGVTAADDIRDALS